MILTQFLLLLHFKTAESAKSTIALPGCPESCGGIPIPYPFGIGRNCSLSLEFNVACQPSSDSNTTIIPVLEGISDWDSFPILNISLSLGQARVSFPAAGQCYNRTAKEEYPWWYPIDNRNSSFRINTEKNKFTVIGCNTLAYLCLDFTTNYSVGCLSSCDSLDTLNKYGSCSGIGCCQTAISKETNSFVICFDDRYNNSDVYHFNPCSYAMLWWWRRRSSSSAPLTSPRKCWVTMSTWVNNGLWC